MTCTSFSSLEPNFGPSLFYYTFSVVSEGMHFVIIMVVGKHWSHQGRNLAGTETLFSRDCIFPHFCLILWLKLFPHLILASSGWLYFCLPLITCHYDTKHSMELQIALTFRGVARDEKEWTCHLRSRTTPEFLTKEYTALFLINLN